MVQCDTGLKENQVEENLEVPTNIVPRTSSDEESDSDYEVDPEGVPGDYMPIPTEEGELQNESTEDESPVQPSTQQSSNDLPPIEPMETMLVKEVWNKPPPKETDIELSTEKVDEVKQVMSNITLPPSAIPDWAKNISEDEWKQQLAKRLQTK